MPKKTGARVSKSWANFDREFKIKAHSTSLKRHIRPATKRVGKAVVAEMKKQIQQGNYKRLGSLQTALKGNSRPLTQSGAMKNSIAAKLIGSHRVFIGIMRHDPQYKYAVKVHGRKPGGEVIKVTRKMRNMFQLLEDVYLRKVSAGILTGRAAELWRQYKGPWYALRPGTTIIRIPARPFVKKTVMNKNLHKAVRKIWQDALMQNYKQMTKRVNRGSKSF